MTQIFSTLARLPQWAWHPGHTPAFQSALYPILIDGMFPTDLLQELVSLLTPDLVSALSNLLDVKPSCLWCCLSS